MISEKKQKFTTSGKKIKKSKNHSLYDYHLAIKQSNNDAKRQRHLGNWDSIEEEGWHLPGTKEPRETCDQWNTVGCTNTIEHEKKEHGRKYYVKQFQTKCKRAECRVCVDSWIVRSSDRGAKRINAYAKQSRLHAIHLSLSPSKVNQKKPEKILRKEAMEILRQIHYKGGALVFHPFKQKPHSVDWYPSPHFHFVGFGWMKFVKEIGKRYGWVVVYHGIRENLFGTFCYLFSHCGIKKGRQAITWLGELSNSIGKLKIEKKRNSFKCPVCDVDLQPIHYAGTHPFIPPDKEFEGFVDPERWYLVNTMTKSRIDDELYEYSSIRSVNEILKGIAEAH